MKLDKVLFSSTSNEWESPNDLYNKLNDKYHFTLDPCCTDYNHKCNKYFTIKDNGLEQDWSKDIVFMNPPYGREIGKWIKKAYDEWIKGATVVVLVPARTDTKWFHNYVYTKLESKNYEFIKGRLKFINRLFPSWREDGNFKLTPAPFPSMLIYYTH
jgi:site-specific DNA-methyltransferase (adenine-specific)